ncbi:MAG: tetratricopeptide repeat protein [Candidatus Delongbacteria bacterium]|nr:tetratricopeptide repeat protein [Candidatus Delongbacteria bacterium]MBN2836782.1 tetratricopeptide repeat protein [Candidatus Delongbacteria bacterium]
MIKMMVIVLGLVSILNAEYIRKEYGNSYKFYDDTLQVNQDLVCGKVIQKYEDNSLYGEFNYQGGLLDGFQKEFYPDGKTKAEYNMKNGLKDGTGKMYYDDGSIYFERNLDNGTGLGTEYYQNGMKKREFLYKDGKLLKASFFNEDLMQNPYERSAEELYAEGQSYAAEKLYFHALDTYQKFLEKYPESPKVPNIKFLIAFTYNNHIMDHDKAKELYEKFISEYPGHDLEQSAKFELNTIGKDLNDIEEFRSGN